jgi:hypothetical protein
MYRNRRMIAIIAVAVTVWALVTPYMWRDLRGRAAGQVRGPKWLWWIASTNLTGSVAYWMFARIDGD